jgi:hypothetical protein
MRPFGSGDLLATPIGEIVVQRTPIQDSLHLRPLPSLKVDSSLAIAFSQSPERGARSLFRSVSNSQIYPQILPSSQQRTDIC